MNSSKWNRRNGKGCKRMIETLVAVILIFIISLIFSMFGKGGGELYLPMMITLLNITFYTAAGVSLFLIFLQSISMVFVYSQKHKLLDWKLALILAIVVGVSSFLGGFVSKGIPALYLKIIFATFLIISAFLLFLNKSMKVKLGKFGVWHREFSGGEYDVHILYLVVPISIAAFLAGMIGISGGGLIVPIAVLLGGMPIRIAMGTNTFLVLVSSSMGFLGHALKGSVDWYLCAVFGVTILIGSQIGSHLHAEVNERNLRIGLATILLFAAIWMIIRVIL